MSDSPERLDGHPGRGVETEAVLFFLLDDCRNLSDAVCSM